MATNFFRPKPNSVCLLIFWKSVWTGTVKFHSWCWFCSTIFAICGYRQSFRCFGSKRIHLILCRSYSSCCELTHFDLEHEMVSCSNSCWSSSAQSFMGLSSAGLVTIFSCLKFETRYNLEGQIPVFKSPRNRVARLYTQALGSLFIASYDSQGYGGGIRPRLHKGYNYTIYTIIIIIQYVISSLCLTGNTLLLRWNDHLVQENDSCVLREPYEAQDCTLWAECRVLVCQSRRSVYNHWALKEWSISPFHSHSCELLVSNRLHDGLYSSAVDRTFENSTS
jgi:hypothetical protein